MAKIIMKKLVYNFSMEICVSHLPKSDVIQNSSLLYCDYGLQLFFLTHIY